MFRLIMGRVAWMDEVGIRQWNVTKYDECYPPEYYAAHAEAGRIFCLADEDETTKAEPRLIAVGLLLEEDERWPDGIARTDEETGETLPAASAYYLHHFATAVGAPKGIGGVFLRAAEEYGAAQGKTWFRLDSADDNETLEAYYTSRGYEPAGMCVDGLYTGILRQKKL